jgi:hypothetical protein
MTTPSKVTIRMYNVGFGDCFLLTFHYVEPLKDQHILIDFGSVGGKADLTGIANDIKEACGGKLYAVVATHRHKDHISGFSDKGGEDSPGAIIRSCRPEIVLQPWTENPDAASDARTAEVVPKAKSLSDPKPFFASMRAMNSFAASVLQDAERWRGVSGRSTTIERLASNNVTNPDAVRNLLKMGRKQPRFLQYGSASGLEHATLLPGVKVTVLGPPNLQQQNLKKYAKSSDEYWMSSLYWGFQARALAAEGSAKLFPKERQLPEQSRPFHTRWFIERANRALKSNLLGIVTILDSFLNNTSLILLFEVNGKKLLFPGDAQLENWSWALSQPGVKELLSGVDLYKVGHHGSRNATPKDLWTQFGKRKSKNPKAPLQTLMSTASGVYQRSVEGQVPSIRLVDALKSDSDLSTTQVLKRSRGPIVIEL